MKKMEYQNKIRAKLLRKENRKNAQRGEKWMKLNKT